MPAARLDQMWSGMVAGTRLSQWMAIAFQPMWTSESGKSRS
jgi:hypothetical protein